MQRSIPLCFLIMEMFVVDFRADSRWYRDVVTSRLTRASYIHVLRGGRRPFIVNYLLTALAAERRFERRAP